MRFAPPADSPGTFSDVGLPRPELIDMLRYMLLHRGVEERGLLLYKQGKVPGSFYTGRGNEGAAVGTGLALRPEDVATATQRDMAVHIIRGLEPWRILAQYMGRVDGPARGRDANVHFADPSLGMVAMVSHMGAMVPIAVGQALAFRIRGEKRVAVTWFGEGASVIGAIHEALNFAGVRRLPVVFVCDNNQWAYSTPAQPRVRHRARRRPRRRLRLRGGGRRRHRRPRRVPRGDAGDREGARGGRPDPARVRHAPDGGPRSARRLLLHPQASCVAEWAKRDPIERYRVWLREQVGFTDDEDAELTAWVSRLLHDAVRRAEESPLPTRARCSTGSTPSPTSQARRG